MYRRLVLSSTRSLSLSATLLKAEPDLITKAFLKEIRDLGDKQKAAGGSLVNTSAEIKKQLEEQLNRLAGKFKISGTEAVGKLEVKFEKAQVESSVAAVTDGKTLDAMIQETQSSLSLYQKEREESRKLEAERAAITEAKDDSKPAVFRGEHPYLYNHPVHGKAELEAPV